MRIRYVCESLGNESHGIENYHEVELREEGWELGEITLLQSSFAVLSVKREAFRRAAYQYPGNNNFVLPQPKFTQEFDGAIFCGIRLRIARLYRSSGLPVCEQFLSRHDHELAIRSSILRNGWRINDRETLPNLADGFSFMKTTRVVAD